MWENEKVFTYNESRLQDPPPFAETSYENAFTRDAQSRCDVCVRKAKRAQRGLSLFQHLQDSSASIDKCSEITQIICFSLCWHFIPNFCFKIKTSFSSFSCRIEERLKLFSLFLASFEAERKKSFWRQNFLDRNSVIAFQFWRKISKQRTRTHSRIKVDAADKNEIFILIPVLFRETMQLSIW